MVTEYAMRRKVSGLPVHLVSVGQLRTYLELMKDKLMVVLMPVSGGYVFHVEPIYQPSKAFELKAEKSGRRRIFRTVETALRQARSLGFDTVQVELSAADYPQGMPNLS